MLCMLALSGAALLPPTFSPPQDLPSARDPGWGNLLDDQDDWSEVPLGVGRLGPAQPVLEAGTGWLTRVVLPIYAQPGGTLQGWIARGWWLTGTDGKRAALPLHCLLETGYETASWVVYAIRDDGWFRFGLHSPCAGAGSVWAHRSHLDMGENALTVELWGDRFLSEGISPLFFRDQRTRHALRTGPAPDAERIAWISADDTFTPLEIEGEWMRARVAQPSDYCADPAQWEGRMLEGWIRWRAPDKGPWVWYFARGC